METNRKLHEALNALPHNTPEGRKMRSHYGERIETVQHFIGLEMSRKKEMMHPICPNCYLNYKGENYKTIDLGFGDFRACCHCGEKTEAGLFVEVDSSLLLCGGKHEDIS